MAQSKSHNPADYIVPLNINGLDGRMLSLPAPKSKLASKREILFIYGHHSSLERWWGLAQVLNRYGAVSMPDLPGFGGMDSFYTIGKKPTIDNLADYLAAFIKLRYKRKKIIIVGMSFGFVIATRMLQRYPELAKRVTLMVSLAGFAHHEDFSFSRPRYEFYYWCTRLLSLRPPAWIFRHVALNTWILRNFYGRTHNAKHKFAQAKDAAEIEHFKDVEVGLWHNNDVRTWAFTSVQFLKFDNCRVPVDVPLWHIGVTNDRYFDNHLVEQHLRVVFKDFRQAVVDLETHAPSVIANEKEAAPLLPAELKHYLSRLR